MYDFSVSHPETTLPTGTRFHFQASEPTAEQEQALFDRAFNSQEALDELLQSVFLGYIHYWATRFVRAYQSFRIEFVDVVQIGSLAVLEQLHAAQSKESPIGYLRASAKFAMHAYCAKHSSLIVTPLQHYKEPHPVDSLDVPMRELDGVDVAETLEAPPLNLSPETENKQFEPIYQALEVLPPRQKEMMCRHYGLGNSPEETISEIAAGGFASQLHTKALKRLASILQSPSVQSSVYTLAVASQRLRVEPSQLSRYVEQGKLQRLGRGYYRKQDVDALAKQRDEMDAHETYTAGQVCALLRLSPKNLSRYAKEHDIRAVRSGVYLKEDVDKHLQLQGVA